MGCRFGRQEGRSAQPRTGPVGSAGLLGYQFLPVGWSMRAAPAIERLGPLGHEHITLTGRYRIVYPTRCATASPTGP